MYSWKKGISKYGRKFRRTENNHGCIVLVGVFIIVDSLYLGIAVIRGVHRGRVARANGPRIAQAVPNGVGCFTFTDSSGSCFLITLLRNRHNERILQAHCFTILYREEFIIVAFCPKSTILGALKLPKYQTPNRRESNPIVSYSKI